MIDLSNITFFFEELDKKIRKIMKKDKNRIFTAFYKPNKSATVIIDPVIKGTVRLSFTFIENISTKGAEIHPIIKTIKEISKLV